MSREASNFDDDIGLEDSMKLGHDYRMHKWQAYQEVRERFMKFGHGYRVRQQAYLEDRARFMKFGHGYQEEFAKGDNDGAGADEAEELAETPKTFGIEPMRQVIDEVFEEVDEDGEDAWEFEFLMELLRPREDFTCSEYASDMNDYQCFDRDGFGEIDTREIIVIFGWLGYALPTRTVTKIISQVESDGSGSIYEGEFLTSMRRVRERETEKTLQVTRANAVPHRQLLRPEMHFVMNQQMFTDDLAKNSLPAAVRMMDKGGTHKEGRAPTSGGEREVQRLDNVQKGV